MELNLTDRQVERFWSYVVKADAPDECWGWTGMTRKGYGRMFAAGNTRSAHRISYVIEYGSVPSNLVVDHLCRNPICTNPRHLEAVTNAENLLRSPLTVSGAAARRTHCKYGHLLDGYKASSRARYCKTCARERERSRSQLIRAGR